MAENDEETIVTLYMSRDRHYSTMCSWCEQRFSIHDVYASLLKCGRCGAIQHNPIGTTKLHIIVAEEDDWEFV